MQPPALLMEPNASIGEALAQLAPEHEGMETGSADAARLVGYRSQDGLQVVHIEDLNRMTAMGLGHLPIECVAVPETVSFRHGDACGENVLTSDYSRRLTAYFPVYFVAALYELQSLMMKINMKGYVIGGMARDLLQFDEKRLSVKDVDITVEGDALLLANFLIKNSRNFEILEEYPEFGTAKVRYKDTLMLDFASTRQEAYTHCGALPVVLQRGVALKDDVIRRDFTMNALALSIHPLGHMLDHTDGLRDLQLRYIRVLHPASFFEDPSRILRALKFCARFGFDLAPETRQLMERFLVFGSDAGYKGGGERIKQELKAFWSVGESPAKSEWLAFFLESGCERLLTMEVDKASPAPDAPEAAAPEVRLVGNALRYRLAHIAEMLSVLESVLSAYVEDDFAFEAYLCLLFRDRSDGEFRRIVHRLGLTKHERDMVESFRRVKDTIGPRLDQVHDLSSPADIYDLFHGLPLMTVVACLAELGLRSETQMRTVLEAFVRYKRKWENLRLELNGNDLIQLGVPEGKAVGRFLDELLHAKLAGQLPDRMAEINAVRRALEATATDTAPPEGIALSVSRLTPDDQMWEQGAWPDVAPPVS